MRPARHPRHALQTARAAATARPAPARAGSRRRVRRPAAGTRPARPGGRLPGSSPTMWLHRALPIPRRRRSARAAPPGPPLRVGRGMGDWAFLLGSSAARGDGPLARRHGDRPARVASSRLRRRDAWNAALALEGRTAWPTGPSRSLATTGPSASRRSWAASGAEAARRRLLTTRVSIYCGGREDVRPGAPTFACSRWSATSPRRTARSTVSSLMSAIGSTAAGVVSAHVVRPAVDVAALGGRSIAGHQRAGGLTETAVRNVLLLPAELRPRQVISLLGLGGPSFPLADHDDHIHVGF